MHAHLIQLDIAWENKPANHARVRELIDQAEIESGDLIVLPELFDVGFTLNIDRACDDDGSTLSFLRSLSVDTQCTIHGSRAVRTESGERGFNCATIAMPDGEVCEFRKIHPFSYGREMESYDAGDKVTSYQWNCGDQTLRVCPAVCYDLRFPELFRLGAKLGAGVFALGANWPSPRAHHWRSLLIARAIENQAYVLGVNRCGDDPHLSYAGGSIAIDPKGEILGELDGDEAVLSVSIDPLALANWRKNFPALNDIKLI